MLQSARDEAENYREKTITLTAQVAALREALRECVTDDDATCYQTRKERRRLMYVSEVARAALAKDGA
jgi:hypothetical protein